MSETLSETIEAAPAPPDLGLAPAKSDGTRTIIRPPRGWEMINLREIWQYRELLYFLTWRDIKVRYKQTVLGTAWSVVQPLVQTLVFAVIFGKMIGLSQTTDVPYLVFLFSGLLPWYLFSGGLSGSSHSVLSSSALITKIYFPRLLIPVASVGVNVVNFCVSFVALLAIMLWYGLVPQVQIVLMPLVVLLILMASLSFGIGLSALMVIYRDVRHIAPFFVQMLLYLTPVIYPVSIIPEQFRWLIVLNPMTGLIDAFRWCVYGYEFEVYTVVVSVAITLVSFIASSFCFRRMETVFADII